MKSFAILALAGLAVAQFNQLPTCAQSCANKFLTGGIGNCGSDAKCICSDKDFLSDIACCLAAPGACDPADQSSAVGFASQLCAAQGVTGLPSVVSCTATSFGSSGTAAAASTTGSNTAKDTSSATAENSSTTTGTGTGTGSTATAASSTATTATTSATTEATTAMTSTGAAAATTSTSTSNPAPRESAGVAGLVGGVIAALAML